MYTPDVLSGDGTAGITAHAEQISIDSVENRMAILGNLLFFIASPLQNALFV
jgi:hypothetical protein